MLVRVFRWWTFAQGVVSALTTPRTDVEASDREVERLVRGSQIAMAVEWLAGRVRRAWADSAVHRVAEPIRASLLPADHPTRVRLAGVIMTIAFAVATLLQRLEPTPLGPLSWILPVAAAGASIVVACAAGPIARALEDEDKTR